MVDFVLEELQSSVTLDLSGAITTDAIPSLDASGTAVFYITETQVKDIFKFQTDSFDISNNPTSDVKYYTHYDAFTALGLNPANAMMNKDPQANAIATVDAASAALPDNKMLVAHDFLRHIALDLFGTHLGVDLFNNETEVIQSIRSVCDDATAGHVMYEINALVNKVSTVSTETVSGLEGSAGSKYMTNANESSENLCRVLMLQMLDTAPERFADIEATAEEQSLPFLVDDSISFKLTISPAAGQKNVTRPASNVEVADRSYRIKLKVVADADATKTNTSPSADEL